MVNIGHSDPLLVDLCINPVTPRRRQRLWAMPRHLGS